MKKSVITLYCVVLMISLSACNNNQTNAGITDAHNTVWTFVDFFYSEDLPWGETVEKDVPEFMPSTKFQWTDSEFIAIKDDIKTSIINGMPIWNVFVTDLNGDEKPEFCATTSLGSGVVDNRVIVFDYENTKYYEISDRMKYDYQLSKQDEKLVILRTDYPYNGEQTEDDNLDGVLSIKDGKLIIEYTNGETKIVTATAQSN